MWRFLSKITPARILLESESYLDIVKISQNPAVTDLGFLAEYSGGSSKHSESCGIEESFALFLCLPFKNHLETIRIFDLLIKL